MALDIHVEANSVDVDSCTERIEDLIKFTDRYDFMRITADEVLFDVTVGYLDITCNGKSLPSGYTQTLTVVRCGNYYSPSLMIPKDEIYSIDGNLRTTNTSFINSRFYMFYLDDGNLETVDLTIGDTVYKGVEKIDKDKYFCMLMSLTETRCTITNLRKCGDSTLDSYFRLIFNILNFIGYKNKIDLVDDSKIDNVSTKIPFLIVKGRSIYMKYGFMPVEYGNILNIIQRVGDREINYMGHKKTIKKFIDKYFFDDSKKTRRTQRKEEYLKFIKYLRKTIVFDVFETIVDNILTAMECEFRVWCSKKMLEI